MGWINQAQQQRDHRGLRDTCAACSDQEDPDGTQRVVMLWPTN